MLTHITPRAFRLIRALCALLTLLVILSPLRVFSAVQPPVAESSITSSKPNVFSAIASNAQPNLTEQRRKLEFAPPPIAFVPNQGQTNKKVRVMARGLGGMLFFTDDEIVLAIAKTRKGDDPANPTIPDTKPHPRTVLRIRYEGANKNPQVEPIDALSIRTSYYIGDDAKQWQRNLTSYAGTVYRQLYPGIDLRFDGPNGKLKSTYTVAPGADPSAIRWRYQGTNPRLDDVGNLVIDLPKISADITATDDLTGTLIEHAPAAWQTIADRRVMVPVRFVIEPNKRVGFVLGAYDTTQPLVIDPTFSTFLGSNASEQGNDIAADFLGYVYMIGTTSSSLFPEAGSGNVGTGDQGGTDIFMAKYTSSGQLINCILIGGNGDDSGNGIAIDNMSYALNGGAGIALVGNTSSTNFPHLNARHTSPLGGQDAVAMRIFDDSGYLDLMSSTYLGGSGTDSANDVAVASDIDPNTQTIDAFIVGTTTSTNFTDHQNTLNFHDAFALRLSETGTTVLYSRFIGGSDLEEGQAIAVDVNNNAYVTGWTLSSAGFNPLNAAQPTYGGAYDAFITKLGPSGVPIYNSYFGGSGQELGYGIALLDDSAYITGHTKSVVLPGSAGKLQQACATGSYGCNDAFITRYSSTGALQWSTYLGGDSFDYGQDIAVDADGNAYLTGYTNSGNFPVASPLQTSFQGLSYDAFVSAVDPTGTKLLYSTYLGGSSTDKGLGIALDQFISSGIHVTGLTASSDFPTFNREQGFVGGGDDAFVAKLSDNLGFEDFGAGAAGTDATADKPQSKLWWNDGIWWSVLFNSSFNKYTIYKLNWPNQWVTTGVAVDDRAASRADALWDNVAKKLYIVSVIPGEVDPSKPVPPNNDVLLYRYSYNSTLKTYSLDTDFPKVVMTGKSETMTIAKDTTGKLWVAYTNAYNVKYQVSADDGVTWSSMATLPLAQAGGLSYDDIATVVAFDGKIGVMWSRHDPEKGNTDTIPAAFYFSVHNDGAESTAWSAVELVATGTCISDDHITIKAPGDGSGKLFAAIKSSYEDKNCGNTNHARDYDTQLWLAVRAANGTWSKIEYGKVIDDHTRPALLLDPINRQIYMFAASPEVNGGTIYVKTTSMDSPSFTNQPGLGRPFINNLTHRVLNNASTTKQTVNGTTNLVVVATDKGDGYYTHNVIDLPGQAPAGGMAYTFGPVADTYVSQASPTSNYATSSSFSAVGGAGSEKQAFLRFTVSGLPAGAVVQTAKLRLYVTNDSTSGGSFNKITNTTWAETMTWNSKPTIDGPLLATLGAVTLNLSYEVDVTSAISGNGTYSFAITLPSSNTNTLGYASREATTTANRPQLIVTTQ